MESKYNIDNFERFLREKTDDFKMYPSKRVWYSIYNNMHPGNRLPSVSMCIILICSLLLVGYLNTGANKKGSTYISQVNRGNNTTTALNTNTAKQVGSFATDQQQAAGLSTLQQSAPNTFNTSSNVAAVGNRSTGTVQGSATANGNTSINQQQQFTGRANNSLLNSKQQHAVHSNNLTAITAAAETAVTAKVDDNTTAISRNDNAVITITTNEIPSLVTAPAYMADNNVSATADNNLMQEGRITATDKGTVNSNQLSEASNNNTSTASTEKNNNDKQVEAAGNKLTAQSDKAWIENYAMYNRPLPKKWAGKLSWQAYITPSVVYRKLYNNTANKSLSGNGNGNFNNTDIDNVVIQKPSFGLETGLSLQYDLFKILKVKAGFQLNYTRYNALGFENDHPIATSITMNSEDGIGAYEAFRTTPYSNNIGLTPVKLHNETYQLSLPIGADVKLLSSNNISWYAGATVQPTFIVYANSYLLSSDRRNYIKDRSMLNRFNLNAGFETYLSFNTNDFTWQAGPQFRTQVFSTNNKVYSVEERLLNFGFKIGVTKKL